MTAPQTAVEVPQPVSRLGHRVLVADRVSVRRRRTQDAFDFLLSVATIVLVLIIGVYAHGTTSGMTQDVRTAFGGILRQILLLPITLFESIFVIAAPVAVIVALAMRKRLRQIIEAIGTGVITALLMSLLIYVSLDLPDFISAPLTVTTVMGSYVVLDALMATLAAFLTVAGEANQMRAIRYSWFFLFLLSFIYVLRGSMTLPSALVSLLIGRAIGSGARYILGFDDNRGGAIDLVDGLLHIGIKPERIIRADLDTSDQPLETTCVTEAEPSGTSAWTSSYYPLIEEDAADTDLGEVELNTLPPASSDVDRHYLCWDTTGEQYDLIVLDPDTRLRALFHDLWNNIRLKGLGRWVSYSLQSTAERSALVKVAAKEAGVMTPATVGVTSAGGSVFTVQQPVTDAQYLDTLPPERLTDQVLDSFYSELKRAHRRGISHRSLSAHSLALDSGDRTWIVNWDEGQVATSNLNRRIDLAQMITVFTLLVGQDRALQSARRVFGHLAVQVTGPIIQRAILPAFTKQELSKNGGNNTLAELRQAMIGPIPDQQVPDITLTRFQLKTVVMAFIGVVALWVILGSLNFQTVAEAVKNANPWWILAAFGLGLMTYVGAALPLAYFVPEKLKLGETIMVQVAASVVTLVAPAGIGPAALNLRYLNKRGTSTPLALATVALVQFTQFVTTVITLLLVVLITGRSSVLELPSNTVLYAVGIVTVLVAGALTIPKVRQEIWKRLEPTWNQIWQRLIWVVGQPKRLIIGIIGNLIMTVSFIAAFGASLAAFGYSLDLTTLAITYLASNSLGSVIPAPGGIGPVEAALTAGLTVAGIPSGVAISTALVYRLVTFYGRAPLGWIALRIMQKRDLI